MLATTLRVFSIIAQNILVVSPFLHVIHMNHMASPRQTVLVTLGRFARAEGSA